MARKHMERDVCKCGVAVTFRENRTTRKIAPIEDAPVENGNITLNPGGTYNAHHIAHVPAGVERFRNHFINCPHAFDFGTKKR